MQSNPEHQFGRPVNPQQTHYDQFKKDTEAARIASLGGRHRGGININEGGSTRSATTEPDEGPSSKGKGKQIRFDLNEYPDSDE
uniref:Uncharacterized protein n=1 Tax=Meloidogyne enterolobii TaxID=390850 RepID=A0A6V7XG88_MELEN|nr:unnamed protein product [Meloidogyne enterolobii]